MSAGCAGQHQEGPRMVAPTEDTERSPATYVPPPFEGLPEVFQPGEHSPRSWRSLRPSKSARRHKRDEPATEAAADAGPAPEAKPYREPVTATEPIRNI